MREYAGVTRNGSADCASIAFRFPLMRIRAFEAQKPRTLNCRSALRVRCARGFKPHCVIPDEKPRTLNRRSALRPPYTHGDLNRIALLPMKTAPAISVRPIYLCNGEIVAVQDEQVVARTCGTRSAAFELELRHGLKPRTRINHVARTCCTRSAAFRPELRNGLKPRTRLKPVARTCGTRSAALRPELRNGLKPRTRTEHVARTCFPRSAALLEAAFLGFKCAYAHQREAERDRCAVRRTVLAPPR
jgi:hypothetical protein